MLRNTN